MVDQTNKFQIIFQLPCSIFVLINIVKNSTSIPEVRTFFFLFDWSITGAKLCFEKPTQLQLDMMINDTVKLVCV